MAQNTTFQLAPATWTLLTDSNITALTFQVQQATRDVLFRATVGATPPTVLTDTIRYSNGEGEINVSLAEMFPGVSGANRVYAYSENSAFIFVSHA